MEAKGCIPPQAIPLKPAEILKNSRLVNQLLTVFALKPPRAFQENEIDKRTFES